MSHLKWIFVMGEFETVSTDFHISSSCSGSGDRRLGVSPAAWLHGLWERMRFTPKCVQWGELARRSIGAATLHTPAERTEKPVVCSVPDVC